MEAVYFDLEEITAVDLASAAAAAPRATLFVAQQGSAWDDGVAGLPLQRIASWKSNEYLDEMMRWVERLFAALRAAGLETVGGWSRHGASLLEVARYRFLFELSQTHHRAWALGEIQRRWSPSRLVWVAAPRRGSETRALRRLGTGGRASRIDLVLGERRSRSRLREDISGRLRPLADRLSGAARAGRAVALPRGSRSRVVFLDFYPNSTRAALPVSRALETAYSCESVWVAGRPAVAAALHEAGTASLAIERLVSPGAFVRGGIGAVERQALARQLPAAVAKAGVGAEEVAGAERFLEHAVGRILGSTAGESALWVELLADALQKLRPSALVSTTYSHPSGRAAALLCGAQGAPSCYLQHGLLPAQFVNSFFCHSRKLVWGDYERRALVDFGHDVTSIEVTGATIYDGLAERAAAAPPRPVPAPGEPVHVALLASRTGGDVVTTAVARRVLVAVARAVAELPGGRLTVKLHPGDRSPMPAESLAAFPGVTLQPDGNSQDLILESDLVIVVSSTTGLEACVCGRPLVTFNLTGMDGYTEYARYGAAAEVRSAEGLSATLRRVLYDETVRRSLAAGRARLLADMLNGAHGDAVERAAAAIATAVSAPGIPSDAGTRAAMATA